MFNSNPFSEYRAAQQQVQENKFLIPEEIPATERTAFHGAAAAAHKAGKTSFNFAGKKHPVTMKKDTANAIADQKEGYSSMVSKKTKDRVDKAVAANAAALAKQGKNPDGSPKNDVQKESKQTHMFDNEKDARAKAKEIGGKYVKGTGKSAGKHAAVAEGMYKDMDTEKSEPNPRSDAKVKADMKKRRGKNAEVEMNPKMDADKKAKPMETKESTGIRNKLLAVLSEKENHSPNVDKAEKAKDNRKGKGAEDMMADADKEIEKGPDAHLNEPEINKDNFKKMTSNVKNAKMRNADNPKGDRKIVPGGTQFKDPTAMKSESYNNITALKQAYASMYEEDIEESYTHEFDYAEDGKHTAKSFVDNAKKAGMKAKIHTQSGPGAGHPVVHLGHKDTKVMHKFLKKHYDSGMHHDDLDAHKI